METEPRLHEQITQLTDFLIKKGYTQAALKPYSRCWKRLTDYAKENGCESFSTTLGSDFLQYEYGVNDIERPTQKEKSPVRAIKLLTTFLQSGNLAAYQKRSSRLPLEKYDNCSFTGRSTDNNDHASIFTAKGTKVISYRKNKNSR